MLDHGQFKDPENGGTKNVELERNDDIYPSRTGTLMPWVLPFDSSSSNWIEDAFLPSYLGLPLAYGGVHLCAWNFEFPTAMESLLWKISGIIIAGIFFAWVAVFTIVDLLLKPEEHLAWIWMVLTIILSIVCRVYIVIEAYISLRAVPIGVYWTPAWIQMIPHV